MSEPDLIGDYLDGLARQLARYGRRRRRRLLDEAREHLLDATTTEMEDGMDSTDAQRHAIRRFGTASRVAAEMGRPGLVRRALPLVVVCVGGLTVLTGICYGFGQQGLRREANDPQVPIARDIAARLSAGTAPAELATGPSVDLATDPRVHVSVFDTAGRALASTARLDGRQPSPPAGVLKAATRSGRNDVTWQPRPAVRVAAVIFPWSGGTVLVGRSMTVMERDESRLVRLLLIGWFVAILVVTAAALGWTWWRGGRGITPPLAPAPAS